MKFLDTTGIMNIVEIEDSSYAIYELTIDNEELDLPLSIFIDKQKEKLSKLCSTCPTLISVITKDMAEEDILYMKDLVIEIIAESICEDKINDDWQPRTAITKVVDTTMKAKTAFLNHTVSPEIINIQIVKDDKVVYNLINERNEE